jgi:gluconokinase
MPVSLLDSQLADLEPLAADERGLVVDIRATPDQIVRRALATLTQEQP